MNAQPEQRSESWYQDRIGRITASRVGSVLGLSKYRTRADVMRDMVREACGAAPEFAGNEATEYGQSHEADALAEYERRAGVMVEPCGVIPHPKFGEWLAASPDGLVGRDGSVECKCPFRSRYTEPSEEYIAQMQLQMECAVRDWCDFAIWRAGEPLIVVRVARDPDWLPRHLPTLKGFVEEYRATISDPNRAAPHLAPLEREDSAWQKAVRAWRHAKSEADSYAAMEKQAREALIALAPTGAKGCGVSVCAVIRAGSIDYARAMKQMLPDVDLSPFKREDTTYYTVKEIKP